MSLSERDAYIKAMLVQSPIVDDSGELERVTGEQYDKYCKPLPEGKVWRWGGFLAMFRAGAAWANDMLAVENADLKAENSRLKNELEQIDTVHSGPLCDHIWTSQPWRAGTYQGNPVYEAVCAKCGQTGESP